MKHMLTLLNMMKTCATASQQYRDKVFIIGVVKVHSIGTKVHGRRNKAQSIGTQVHIIGTKGPNIS